MLVEVRRNTTQGDTGDYMNTGELLQSEWTVRLEKAI